MEHFAVVVIGAGQAGLACAQQLSFRGLEPGEDFIVLDANEGPGGAWRHRWDSLTLDKAHGIADLPSMKAPTTEDGAGQPASRVVSDYYQRYEEQFHLAVRRPARAVRVEEADGFIVTLADGTEYGSQVIVNATGTWDSPYIPDLPGLETFGGHVLHTHDFVRREDFAGQRTLIIGGGLSAVQFLLELEGVTDTMWSTRRVPDFVRTEFDQHWGRNVEEAVRERTFAGYPPASVVSATGIPPWEEYAEGVQRGVLVSRGTITQVTPTGVVFGDSPATDAALAYWDPFPAGHREDVDILFFNTGFRHSLRHLEPLGIFSQRGGIEMTDEVTVKADPRILLAGYGSTASTRGATRAGRLAAKRAAHLLFPGGR